MRPTMTTGILKKMLNKKTGKKEWALVSRSNPKKVLKWFGPKKPSHEEFLKEERRVQFWKHFKGGLATATSDPYVMPMPAARKVINILSYMRRVYDDLTTTADPQAQKKKKLFKEMYKRVDTILKQALRGTSDKDTVRNIVFTLKDVADLLDKLEVKPKIVIKRDPKDKTAFTVYYTLGRDVLLNAGTIVDETPYAKNLDTANFAHVPRFVKNNKAALSRIVRYISDEFKKPDKYIKAFPARALKRELIHALKLFVTSAK